jgi:hypothetical protein
MIYRAAVKTGVVFRLEEQEAAKEFVSFFQDRY